MTDTGTPVWGDGIRAIRSDRRLSQVELAARVGVPQADISRYESGARKPTDAIRVRIAKALGVDPHSLFPYLDDEDQAS